MEERYEKLKSNEKLTENSFFEKGKQLGPNNNNNNNWKRCMKNESLTKK